MNTSVNNLALKFLMDRVFKTPKFAPANVMLKMPWVILTFAIAHACLEESLCNFLLKRKYLPDTEGNRYCKIYT